MKTYIVTIGETTSFVLKAENLKEAKKMANFNKRMQKYKGRTIVRLKK